MVAQRYSISQVKCTYCRVLNNKSNNCQIFRFQPPNVYKRKKKRREKTSDVN